MKILYIDPNNEFRKLHVIYLENILSDVEVVEKINIQQAIEILKRDKDFSLILTEAQTPQGKATSLWNYVRSNLPHIPFVLFSEDPPELYPNLSHFTRANHKNQYIPKPVSPVEFRNIILNILQSGRIFGGKAPAFHKVRSVYFWRFNKVLCDVFQKKGERQYVKVIPKNTSYSKEDIDSFILKDNPFLYIKNDDFEKFSVGFTRFPFLVEEMEADPSKHREQFQKSHEIMHELVSELGISSEVIELTERTVQEISNLALDQSQLKDLLIKFRESKNYLYDHSYLLSLIGSQLCLQLGLKNEETKQIIIASIFHDITLDDPQIAMARNEDELANSSFSKIDREVYKGHAEAAANLLKESPLYDPEVDTILRDHHHVGEPIQGKFDLTNLSKLFIMAHEYVYLLYKNELDTSKTRLIVDEMALSYKSDEYKPLIEVFQKSFS